MPEAVAQRYARAFAEVVGPQGDFAKATQELETFAEVYRESAELREVFESPAVKPQQKQDVLNAILARLGTSAGTGNFLRVLLDHYRINKLDEIRADFQAIANDELGVAEMKVISAAPLSEIERGALAGRFHDLTRKRVEIEYGVDPALVGGVVAQIKSVIYDGSVRGSLDRIREQIGARG
ncbi:MAG: ATP synthase F1 subunit delta [Terriglobia bacterium]